jgi:putative ABC transport system ATP-binding protein
MTAAPPVIRIRALSKSYQRGEQFIPVLEGMDLDVAMKPNSSPSWAPAARARARLLNLIAGIDQPSGGTIEIGGVEHRAAARG